MKVIQILEDDIDLRENIAEILELNGYKITPAGKGESDIEIFNSYKPHLVICDIEKRKSTGQNFIEHFKNEPDFSKVPLIFLTTASTLPEWFKYSLHNYFGCLKKPFMEEELLEAVSLCLPADGNHLPL